jgi:hypothetical protein
MPRRIGSVAFGRPLEAGAGHLAAAAAAYREPRYGTDDNLPPATTDRPTAGTAPPEPQTTRPLTTLEQLRRQPRGRPTPTGPRALLSSHGRTGAGGTPGRSGTMTP